MSCSCLALRYSCISSGRRVQRSTCSQQWWSLKESSVYGSCSYWDWMSRERPSLFLVDSDELKQNANKTFKQNFRRLEKWKWWYCVSPHIQYLSISHVLKRRIASPRTDAFDLSVMYTAISDIKLREETKFRYRSAVLPGENDMDRLPEPDTAQGRRRQTGAYASVVGRIRKKRIEKRYTRRKRQCMSAKDWANNNADGRKKTIKRWYKRSEEGGSRPPRYDKRTTITTIQVEQERR